MESSSLIAYIVSQELAKVGNAGYFATLDLMQCARSISALQISSLLPANKNRSLMVHSLVSSLGLLENGPAAHGTPQIQVIKPARASYKDLALYHSRDYLDFVLNPENSSTDDTEDAPMSQNIDFGLQDDCPAFVGLAQYVPVVAGASLSAVHMVRQRQANLAICWDGGRHHAQKSHAAGFCYVADCVLAILALKRPGPAPGPARKTRVMYLDLDVHFSDAVSHAFYSPNSTTSPQVLTLSIHHSAPGFFPISPLSSLPEPDNPAFDPLTLSIPLQEGASNPTFARIWPLVEGIKNAFEPDFIVLQCGVDGLAGDPCGRWNWALGGGEGSMGWCVDKVTREWTGGKVLLGGGGYNSPNAARAWAYLTSIALERPLPLDTAIPEHAAFPAYAPSFTLDVPAGNMQDMNRDEYLSEVERVYERVIGIIQARLAEGPKVHDS